MTQGDMTSRALGLFSLGLGTAQIAAPRAVAQLIGLRPGAASQVLLRLVGVREVAAGVGILTQRRPAGLLWARVAGDIMDLALLGNALRSDHANRQRVGAAMAAVTGVAAADLQSAQRLSQG